MNPKGKVDSAVIKILYRKYKSYVIPVIAILVCWYVFFQFVVPQIQSFLAVKSTVDTNEQILAVMTQNYNTIASLDSTKLDQQLTIANDALPAEKDFAGILNAISNAAGISGAIVNDYSFELGDLTNTPTGLASNQTVQLALTLKGTIEQAKKFLKALDKQLPISQVTSINIVSSSAISVGANFFFSTASTPLFNATQPLPVITSGEKKLLQTLSQNAGVSAPLPIIPTQSSTSSAVPTTIPTRSPTGSVSSSSASL